MSKTTKIVIALIILFIISILTISIVMNNRSNKKVALNPTDSSFPVAGDRIQDGREDLYQSSNNIIKRDNNELNQELRDSNNVLLIPSSTNTNSSTGTTSTSTTKNTTLTNGINNPYTPQNTYFQSSQTEEYVGPDYQQDLSDFLNEYQNFSVGYDEPDYEQELEDYIAGLDIPEVPTVTTPTTTTTTTTTTGTTTASGPEPIDGRCTYKLQNAVVPYMIEGYAPLSINQLCLGGPKATNIDKSANFNQITWTCPGQNGGNDTFCKRDYYETLPTGSNCGPAPHPNKSTEAEICLNGSTNSATSKTYMSWYPLPKTDPYFVYYWTCNGNKRIDKCAAEYDGFYSYTFESKGEKFDASCKIPDNPRAGAKEDFCAEGTQFSQGTTHGDKDYVGARHVSGSGLPAVHSYSWACLKGEGLIDFCEASWMQEFDFTRNK